MTLFYCFYAFRTIVFVFFFFLTNLCLIKFVSMFVYFFVSLCWCLFCRCLLLRRRPQRSLQSVLAPSQNHFEMTTLTWPFLINTNGPQSSWKGLESLKGTFIPDVYKERTGTKLLNPMGDVFEDIIREFFANAIVEGDHINCWLRGRKFSISRESNSRGFGDSTDDFGHISTI